MPNMLGAYGDWAAGLAKQPKRRATRDDFLAALMQPDAGGVPKASLIHQLEFDGLSIEHLNWQLPYGPPTEAIFLKPAGAQGRLPGVIALFDHGGNKYFGTAKITRMGNEVHPMVQGIQQQLYGGRAWANELARRGYAVLVADVFAFGSRRIRLDDVPANIRGAATEDDIRSYNTFAGTHEHIIAKSLFSAGTTWPGVFTAEDQRAIDYLCSRPDVDPARIGCAGLSGGGLRTVYLTGVDRRIRCSCCAGMMTTWHDFILNKSSSHTWMVYVPGLANHLDYAAIMGLNAPSPVMVLNNREDQLFTVSEMERADQILSAAYKGHEDRYQMKFYPGPHKFDVPMQEDAFKWLDRWLKS